MVVFEPISHTYENSLTKAKYPSVTTVLSEYKRPFDADFFAGRVAKRDGLTVTEVKAKWAQINKDGLEYGKKIHTGIEVYLKTGKILEECRSVIESYIQLNLVTPDDNVLSEYLLYSHRYEIAGTADIIKLEGKGTFSVFDIKTNKKIDMYNKYGDHLLYPLEHLTNSEYTVYGLQLSLYAYLYNEMTGRVLNQLGIQFYDRNIGRFIFYPVPYLKTDVVNLLNHFRG